MILAHKPPRSGIKEGPLAGWRPDWWRTYEPAIILAHKPPRSGIKGEDWDKVEEWDFWLGIAKDWS